MYTLRLIECASVNRGITKWTACSGISLEIAVLLALYNAATDVCHTACCTTILVLLVFLRDTRCVDGLDEAVRELNHKVLSVQCFSVYMNDSRS